MIRSNFGQVKNCLLCIDRLLIIVFYPDFIFKLKTGKKYMVEIKPYKQCFPPKAPKKQSRYFIREQLEYLKNQAKWTAAKTYCEGNDLEFKIFTEKDIGVYN